MMCDGRGLVRRCVLVATGSEAPFPGACVLCRGASWVPCTGACVSGTLHGWIAGGVSAIFPKCLCKECLSDFQGCCGQRVFTGCWVWCQASMFNKHLPSLSRPLALTAAEAKTAALVTGHGSWVADQVPRVRIVRPQLVGSCDTRQPDRSGSAPESYQPVSSHCAPTNSATARMTPLSLSQLWPVDPSLT